MTDEQLLAAYRADADNRWLGYLLQRYTGMLLGVAYKYLKDRNRAEDAVQQVFETAITKLPAGEIGNLKGWLYVLMRNYCLQQLRDKRYFVEESVAELPTDSVPEQETIAWYEQTLTAMEGALGELNEEQRLSVTLFYLQKCSYEQIIERTGFTFMQVKSYIQNGKRNLKLLLTKKLEKGKL